MSTRRDLLHGGALGLAVAAAEVMPGRLMAQQAPASGAVTPAIGDRIVWPSARLLDGRPIDPPAPGQMASVIVFFSTTCPYCARHNAHVQKLLENTRGQPLRVLAVAQDSNEAHVRTYLQRRSLNFDVSMDHAPLRSALTRMNGIPLTCVVDRQQRLREVIRGEMFEDDVLGLAKWART
jgi:peroxiredoxin